MRRPLHRALDARLFLLVPDLPAIP